MKKTIRMPLTHQIFISFCIFIICTFFVILYRTYDYNKLQSSYMNDSLESYSAQITKSTNDSYEFYKNICYNIGYNQSLLKILSSNKIPSMEDYQQIQNLIANTASLNPYIVDIAVYGKNDTFFSLNGVKDTYKPFIDEYSNKRFSYQSVGTATIENIHCHIMAIPIYSLDTGESHFLGLLFISIDVDNFFSNGVESKSQYSQKIVFTNEDNFLIYGDENLYNSMPLDDIQNLNGIYEITLDDVNYSMSSSKIDLINHNLFIFIDTSQNTKQLLQISSHLAFSMIILSVFFLFILILFFRPLINSLIQLRQFMSKVSKGNVHDYKKGTQIDQGFLGSREIDEITEAFSLMLKEIDNLNHNVFENYTRMYELEANNRKTEIAFLRSQVNPHFLYNTLTMICGIASVGEYDKIINVTNALSQIFRYSIKGKEMVTLREELNIVSSYLMIQKERFEDRFTVRYEFEESSYDCFIPKMVIQPLVENAIEHGIEKSLDPCTLLIGAGHNKEHNYLAIWVYDTGVGIPEKKLDYLRSKINNYNGSVFSKEEPTESIGLTNVNSRMVLYYGQDFTIILDSEEGVGTNVQLRIPYWNSDK